MSNQCEFSDAISATEAWEKFRAEWMDMLKAAKQPNPTPEQVSSLRDTFVEAFILGRLSK